MDTVDAYRELLEQVLTEYAKVPYAYGEIQTATVFDRAHNHYLLVKVGWRGYQRIYGTVVHVDMLDEKFWIQYDGTEDGIANDLVRAGIPKERIVLGFQEPQVRQYTEFAIA